MVGIIDVVQRGYVCPILLLFLCVCVCVCVCEFHISLNNHASGHPTFAMTGFLRSLFPSVPVVAPTGTATRDSQSVRLSAHRAINSIDLGMQFKRKT